MFVIAYPRRFLCQSSDRALNQTSRGTEIDVLDVGIAAQFGQMQSRRLALHPRASANDVRLENGLPV